MQSIFKTLILSLAFVTITNSAFAQDEKFSISILTPAAVKSAIGEPPLANSAEEKADVKALIALQDLRTIEQCDYAQSQSSANLKSLFVENNGPLTAKEASQVELVTFKNYALAGLNIYLAKKLYNRPRPYDAHPEVKPCIELEGSTSFPSGHATIARYYANVLSDYFPAKRAALFKRAAEAASNRLVGGVHYPSDIAAGQKLGDALYELFKAHEREERD